MAKNQMSIAFIPSGFNLKRVFQTKRSFITFLVVSVSLVLGARAWLGHRNSIFQRRLETESFKTAFPTQSDQEGSDWRTLTFGYHLGPWPVRFQGNPVVMTMGYQKGPPEKFIPEMIQIWSPGSAELSIEGPRTPIPGFGVLKWKSCLDSVLFCLEEKQKLVGADLKDLARWKKKVKRISWFESDSLNAARGVHVEIDLDRSRIDRFILISDKGNTQNFTLTTSMTPTGEEARALFWKVIAGMTVKDELGESRAWVHKMIQSVQLEKIRKITDSQLRYEQLIGVENTLFSQLAVDPRSIAPFFHLAGVVHLLGTSLIHEKKTYFKNQESWIIGTHSLLSALVKYVKDFPDTGPQKVEREAALADMESLLEDFLLLEQKASRKSK